MNEYGRIERDLMAQLSLKAPPADVWRSSTIATITMANNTL